MQMIAENPSPEQLRECLVRAEKCMSPPTLILAYSCVNGHGGTVAKCDPHGQDDGSQVCVDCATATGERVTVAITVLRRL